MRSLLRLAATEMKLFVREPMVLTFVFAFPVLTVLVLGGVFDDDDPELKAIRAIRVASTVHRRPGQAFEHAGDLAVGHAGGPVAERRQRRPVGQVAALERARSADRPLEPARRRIHPTLRYAHGRMVARPRPGLRRWCSATAAAEQASWLAVLSPRPRSSSRTRADKFGGHIEHLLAERRAVGPAAPPSRRPRQPRFAASTAPPTPRAGCAAGDRPTQILIQQVLSPVDRRSSVGPPVRSIPMTNISALSTAMWWRRGRHSEACRAAPVSATP